MSFNQPNSATAPRLSDSQLRFYRREGYLVLTNVFSRYEVEMLAEDAQRVCDHWAQWVDTHNMRTRFQRNVVTGEPLFEVFDPIADLSAVAQGVAVDRRILGPLHDLYGEPAELIKDKLIFKQPGASGAPLHQDWIAWPGFPESFVTVVLAIDPFTLQSGATEVYPRLHQQGCLSPRDGQFHLLILEQLPVAPVPLLLQPGDIAIFSGFTPHGSGPNREPTPRRGYFLSYNSRSDGGSQYAEHYRQFHAWLRLKTPEPTRSLLYFR